MSDLNILRMMTGDKPGYVDGLEMWAQRLLIVIMASEDNDVGRAYGGELAAMVGGAVLSPDALSLQISSSIPEALVWMKRNGGAPDDLSAEVTDIVVDGDRTTVLLTVTQDGRSTTVSATV